MWCRHQVYLAALGLKAAESLRTLTGSLLHQRGTDIHSQY